MGVRAGRCGGACRPGAIESAPLSCDAVGTYRARRMHFSPLRYIRVTPYVPPWSSKMAKLVSPPCGCMMKCTFCQSDFCAWHQEMCVSTCSIYIATLLGTVWSKKPPYFLKRVVRKSVRMADRHDVVVGFSRFLGIYIAT